MHVEHTFRLHIAQPHPVTSFDATSKNRQLMDREQTPTRNIYVR